MRGAIALFGHPRRSAMRKILAAVDGSDPGLRAAQYASNVAATYTAELTLVHSVESYPILPGDFPLSYRELEVLREKQGRELLKDIAAKLETPQLRIGTRLVHGSPAEAITHLAKEEGYDLVVVGSKGRNAMSRVLVGSVTDRLVHLCEAAVLVVR
jgi:nucleotide-binding universal stress UspA family protein